MQLIRACERPFVPASHEDPQQPGVYKRVIRERPEILDGRVQMINWARLPAGASFRAHYHEDMEETFILVAGTCQMDVEGASYQLEVGDTLVVAPREVHRMENHGDTDVQYLVVGVSLGQGGKTILVE